ncbi:hypothetical protein C8D89_1107 [Actinomycetospora cinnamomea]|uniref:Uncharacterized protein n=1 Tax=Actinomycetospora cinnamomea TaxID=663609 RepID=A0A2U1F6Q9_9PSEU|nr:hypothetical protein C8D89_1107 [Actinomycetospora cinnamomea]
MGRARGGPRRGGRGPPVESVLPMRCGLESGTPSSSAATSRRACCCPHRMPGRPNKQGGCHPLSRVIEASVVTYISSSARCMRNTAGRHQRLTRAEGGACVLIRNRYVSSCSPPGTGSLCRCGELSHGPFPGIAYRRGWTARRCWTDEPNSKHFLSRWSCSGPARSRQTRDRLRRCRPHKPTVPHRASRRESQVGKAGLNTTGSVGPMPPDQLAQSRRPLRRGQRPRMTRRRRVPTAPNVDKVAQMSDGTASSEAEMSTEAAREARPEVPAELPWCQYHARHHPADPWTTFLVLTNVVPTVDQLSRSRLVRSNSQVKSNRHFT